MGWVRVGENSLNGNERNVLLRNVGERENALPQLIDAAYVSGVDRIEDGRGVGIIDVDSNGRLDLVVQNAENDAVLLVNQGPAGHWLGVRLQGTISNRDAIGARVEARVGQRTIMREVTTTGGYISGRSLFCHFGLGAATTVDELIVTWPVGGVPRLYDVAVDRVLHLVE
jgi:hypothetical protein